MRFGMFLQYFGVLVAVIGFIIAGKVNHAELQVPALVVGVVISVIGFLKHLETPVKEKAKIEEYRPRYTTKAEKNWVFVKSAIYHVLLLFLPSYLNSDDIVEFKIFFVPLALMYVLFMIREARDIYYCQ